MKKNLWFYLCSFVLLLGIVITYLNHFNNAFHFDDFHTVTDNIYIRDIGNISDFFTDPATRSTLPTNRQYRPVLTTSLAIDYWIAGGLNPFLFPFINLYLVHRSVNFDVFSLPENF